MKKIYPVLGPVAIILSLALLRLMPHIPNFAPITAMALFGGAYLNKRYAFIIPIAAMMVSDYLLLYIHPFSAQMWDFSHVYAPLAMFTSASWAVYASFLLSGAVGYFLRERISVSNVFLASIFCSLQFFLLTNAAVWMSGVYDRSILGLWESYVMGLPFLRGTMIGDLFYTASLFGGYEYVRAMAKKRLTAWAVQ